MNEERSHIDNDTQERVDAYLRGEMSNEQRVQFENDLKADPHLEAEYLSTKAIAKAIADRQQKLATMALWDSEDSAQQNLLMRRKNICRWTIGVSAAACVTVLFFAARSVMFNQTADTCPGYVVPDFSQETCYRGSDNLMQQLDSLINAKDYMHALEVSDMLLNKYNSELDSVSAIKPLTEKDEYNMEMCRADIEEVEWRKAHLFIALENTKEAKEILMRIKAANGYYSEQADSLLKTL